LRDHLEEERWESLKSRVLGNASWDHRQTSGSIKQIHVPNATRLALYQSKTRVRIDKARKRLGYVPQFDFEHGMELTTRFIRWANLA